MLPLAFLLAAPPAPAFTAGDELRFVGHVEEVSERPELPYRRRHALEVRVFPVSVGGTTDLAVLTVLTAEADPAVAGAAAAVSGKPAPAASPPSATLTLVRLDAQGRPRKLIPPATLPLVLSPRTPTDAVPAPPPDAPAAVELGVLPPPADEAGWASGGRGVWAGAEVLERTGTVETGRFAKPTAGELAVRTTTRLWVSAADGLPRVLDRTSEVKTGPKRDFLVTTHLEQQPPTPHRGEAFQRARKELEQIYALSGDLAAAGPRVGPVVAKAEQLREDVRPAYRPAVETLLRKAEAVRAGGAVVAATAAVAELGRPAPDFAAGGLPVSTRRPTPVLLVFVKPGSETAGPTLTVCDKLKAKYPDGLTVLALSAFAPPPPGSELLDGTAARSAYAVETAPRFYLLDSAGILRWQFEGIGPEVGFLANRAVAALLAPPAKSVRPAKAK